MSEVLVFISANLEWDCSSLSLHAPLLRTGGGEKNYIYIFRREKKELWNIHNNEIELTFLIYSLFKLDNHFSEEGYSNSFEFLFNPDPSRVNCFDIN